MHQKIYKKWYMLKRKDGKEIKTTNAWRARLMQTIGWRVLSVYQEGFTRKDRKHAKKFNPK